MGQLVKLYDYISRYETDCFHYPSSFIRLKKKQWEQLRSLWEEGQWPVGMDETLDAIQDQNLEKEKFWTRIKKFRFRKKEEEDDCSSGNANIAGDEFSLLFQDFRKRDSLVPKDLEELKIHFLDELFQVQLLWASSTLTHRSYVDSSFYRDQRLKYFLQRFPDTILVFYKPIFLLKKAPVESDIILLTPDHIFVLAFLEENDDEVFYGADGRFWEKQTEEGRKKFLNPTISLQRTENIIRQLLSIHDVAMPVSKIVLSRNGYIDYPSAPFGLMIVDLNNYDEWFQKMRNLRKPIKHQQLKAAKAMLSKCKTNAVIRFNS